MGAPSHLALLLYLLSATLCPAETRDTEADADLLVCQASDLAMDLLFLVDSSGSMTSLEISQTRDLLQRLVGGFSVGPGRVQLSLVLVSDQPSLAFSFQDPHSAARIQETLGNLEHGWGDTNSGLALTYARERVFVPEAGARENASRVILWITDGLSTDKVVTPALLLKEMGVKILVVSTGSRSTELSTVASEPTEDTLFFVQAESLSSVAGDLCRAVIDSIAPRALQVSDVTPQSFRVSWPRSLGHREDHLIIDYNRIGDSMGQTTQRFWRRLPGTTDSTVLSGLTPNSTYEVTLLSPQGHNVLWVSTRTEEEESPPEQIRVGDPGVHSLSLAWPGMLKHVQQYQVVYGPVLGGLVRSLTLNGSAEGVFLSPLKPNTQYLISVQVELHSGRQRMLSASGRTRPGVPQRPPPNSLMLTDVTSSGLVASWASSWKPALEYEVHLGGPGGHLRSVTVPRDVQMVFLRDLEPSTLYSICIRAVYSRGISRGACEKKKTLAAPMPRRQVYCPPPPWKDRQRIPFGRRRDRPQHQGTRIHRMGLYYP